MQVIAAYDSNRYAVATYNQNWHPVAQVANLANWKKLDIPDCDGIIAGPPCQDASRLKSSGVNQGRSQLYVETAHLIAAKHPAWALLENVPNMAKAPEFITASQILWDAGYWITTVRLNHAAFGGLTTRDRLFLIASKKMLSLPSPSLTPREYRAHGPAVEPLLAEREPDGWGGANLVKLRIEAFGGDATFNSQQHWAWRSYRRWDEPMATLTKSSNGLRSRLKGQVWKWGVAERSLVQGFPSSFKGLSHAQIGNSVPPELARAWGRVIRSAYGDDQQVVSLFCGAGGLDFIQDAA